MFKTCIFPDEKTQFVPESPKRKSYNDNPYFDENTQRLDDEIKRNVSIPSLGHNMMRRLQRDPYDIYEPVKVLGTGSMGYVNMVKKRDDVVGGTARWHNLSTRKQLELTGFDPNIVTIATLPVLGNIFQKCSGIDEYIKERGNSASKNLTERTQKFDSSGSSAQGSISSQEYDSGGDSNPLEMSQHPAARLLPRHVRINSYINEQRRRGKSEVYYALKSIHLSRVHDPVFVRELKNEIDLMKRFDHAHIVRPIETFENKGHLYMVMELCSGGDLYSRDPYTEAQAARIVGSIVNAVAYMHKHNVIHRDLKYENIMFANSSDNAEIKIIDFGLSKKFLPNQRLREGVGTVYTMSPQVLKGDYTSKADVWAIGVLTYMLLSSQMPFYGRKRREILDKISKCKYDFRGKRWASISPQATQFVSELLQYDRDERPSAEEAKSSFWLNGGYTASIRTTPATEDDMDVVRSSIENYSSHLKLRKLALMVIAHKSTSEEIGFLRKVFKKYDHDMNGSIQLDEFKMRLSTYGFSDAYMENLFKGADLDGTGSIKYTEFLAATIESTGLVTEQRIAEAFDRLDSDDSGYISAENLRELLGTEVPDTYIAQIIAEADLKNKNKISYEEFLEMWNEDEEDIDEWRGISAKRTVKNLAEEMFHEDSDFLSGDEGPDSCLSRIVEQ